HPGRRAQGSREELIPNRRIAPLRGAIRTLMAALPDHSPWRPMQAADLAAVQAIADRVHPDFFEAPAILAEKHALYPAGCFVHRSGDAISGQISGQISGYVFAHPWPRG